MLEVIVIYCIPSDNRLKGALRSRLTSATASGIDRNLSTTTQQIHKTENIYSLCQSIRRLRRMVDTIVIYTANSLASSGRSAKTAIDFRGWEKIAILARPAWRIHFAVNLQRGRIYDNDKGYLKRQSFTASCTRSRLPRR